MKSDMAWQPDAHFDADAWSAPVLGIASSLADHDSVGTSTRAVAVRQGCTRLTFGDRISLLPPSRAAWIPGACAIAHRCARPWTTARCFDATLSARLPQQPAIIGVGPLLQALLEPIAQAPFDRDWRAPRAHHQWRCACWRSPPRWRRWTCRCHAIHASRAACRRQLPPELGELAARAGLSVRTVGRLMQRDTGMGYQAWRQQWRLMRAHGAAAA